MAAGTRDHGRVLCKIWNDKEFRALPRTAQALYIQLLSQPTVNNAGVQPLMLSKWAKGCNEIDADSLMRDLAILVERRFIVIDTETEEVLIRSYIRHDGLLKHKYLFKNALTCAEAVESEALRKVLADELRRTRRVEARKTIEILDPYKPDPDPDRDYSGWGVNAEVNPTESHSDPVGTRFESPMAFRPDSNHPGVGEGEYVTESSKSPYVGVARASESRFDEPPPPRGPVVDVDGWKLVRDEIPDEHPHPVRTDLAIRAGALLKSGTPEADVRAALALWLTKPNVGPGVLPSLVSEVVKNRNRPAATAAPGGSTADQRVAQAQAVRAMFAAQEQAERKALEQ
ncbi:hypothetical protein [Nocardia concava]|uniref:hypothetical protein n=1 Tax=Nocardia concava TaxID=257281 RepID=UPI0003098350|nr:hypothetical protein [Nocardia concava]